MVRRYKDFQPQNISNTLWAFATLAKSPSEAFLDTVEAHVLENLPDYSAQASWPNRWAHTVVDPLTRPGQEDVLGLQGLENILWSFATMNYMPANKVLAATADFMSKNLHQYNQQNLALTLWAYAKLGYEVTLRTLAL